MKERVTLLFRDEAIVVGQWHMHCELLGTFARRHCFCHSPNVFNCNTALDLFFVDVVDCIVCDCEGSLLRPVEHVRLLYFARVY